MNPSDLYRSDRIEFEAQLADLLGSAGGEANASAASPTSSQALTARTSTTTPNFLEIYGSDGLDDTKTVWTDHTSPGIAISPGPVAGCKRAPLPDQPPVKKQKISRCRDLYIHPSRRVLLSEAAPDSTIVVVPSPPVSPSGSNGLPLGSGPGDSTRGTIRNVVQRQWDTRKDGLSYEAHLELRRKEKIVGVDRYVPSRTGSYDLTRSHESQSFRFDELPDKVKDTILSLLLRSKDPIRVDFTWLRTFVSGHARMPTAINTLTDESGSRYDLAVRWDTLVAAVAQMKSDMIPFKAALEAKAKHSNRMRAPCRNLTTSLLFVSRSVNRRAAQIFYRGNHFHFPWATSGWMQLESFLATIGSTNVTHLRNIRVHAPLWHRGVEQDFVEGAMLDLTAPASRMAIVKPPPSDRLLSAVQSCVKMFLDSHTFATLALDLEHGPVTDHWSGRITDRAKLISVADAENAVLRKQKGMDLLRRLSQALPDTPVLTVHHLTRVTVPDTRDFRKRLASVHKEADKYNWKVDSRLKDPTRG